MEQVARAIAGGPRLLVRALVVCFFVALWLLLGDSAADAVGRDDAPGLSVAPSVPDTVTSGRDVVSHSGTAVETVAEPVAEVAGDAEETGRRAAEATVGAVEDAVGRTADKVDRTTERVRSVVEDTTRHVTEVVATPEPAPAPRPEPARHAQAPAPEPAAHHGGDADVREGTSRAAEPRESLATMEDPALLVLRAPPPLDLAEAASAVTESVTADVLPTPVSPPAPGGVVGEDAAIPGCSGLLAPASVPAAPLATAVPDPALALVTGASDRALTPPADRATSPGTTPD